MKAEWFHSTIDAWAARIPLSRDQRARAAELLAEVSTANGGVLVGEGDLQVGIGRAFAVARAEEALGRRVNLYASELRRRLAAPDYWEADQENGGPLPNLRRRIWKKALDLNTATRRQLVDLPAVGEVLAHRILAQRLGEGALGGLADLDEIEGVGPKTLEDLRQRVHFGDTLVPPFLTPELRTFFDDPSFDAYVALIAATGGAFRPASEPQREAADLLLAELEATVDDLAAHRGVGLSAATGVTRAEVAERELRRRNQAAEIASAAVTDVEGVVLLRDGDYQRFVEELLPRAKNYLYLTLFLMRYVEEKKYPTDAVIDALVAAQQRNVEVRVILDRDRQGDKYHSRIVNAPAFRYLASQGVRIRFDKEDRLMHAKTIVIDDLHVVTGSHNWTAGSFQAYADTSIYVASPQLAARLKKSYLELWDSLRNG